MSEHLGDTERDRAYRRALDTEPRLQAVERVVERSQHDRYGPRQFPTLDPSCAEPSPRDREAKGRSTT
jgi:hypothetical protein